MSAYPVLEELRRIPPVNNCRELTSGACSLAWGFHGEALNLWYQSLPPAVAYDEVWVFEDDVGWAGKDIAQEFFCSFLNNQADLISSDCNKFDRRWYWSNVFSAAYGKRIPASKRRVSREHVQRFSKRLLDRLHTLALAGCSAWSETLCVSVCNAEPDLVFALLPKALLGVYCYDGRIGKQRWTDIMGGRTSRFRCKLYHALKW